MSVLDPGENAACHLCTTEASHCRCCSPAAECRPGVFGSCRSDCIDPGTNLILIRPSLRCKHVGTEDSCDTRPMHARSRSLRTVPAAHRDVHREWRTRRRCRRTRSIVLDPAIISRSTSRCHRKRIETLHWEKVPGRTPRLEDEQVTPMCHVVAVTGPPIRRFSAVMCVHR